MQSKIRHSEEELNRKGGSSVQVADSVEVEEHVERLVRCAHFRLEEGDRQQVSPTTRWKYAKLRSCWDVPAHPRAWRLRQQISLASVLMEADWYDLVSPHTEIKLADAIKGNG